MKLSYEDKVQIYDLRQKGTSWPSLSKQFRVAESRLKYIVRLIDRYGIGIVKKEKNTYYPPELKQEMIDFTLSRSPNLMQVKTMLEKAFPEETYPNTILHSDQGWQYQHDSYHRFLESKGMRPSMSRKGSSTDNGMMESFFGVLKTEMFYGFEKTFKSLDYLEQAITDYIFYYNNKRIKAKLKGLSPVQYRTKSFGKVIIN